MSFTRTISLNLLGAKFTILLFGLLYFNNCTEQISTVIQTQQPDGKYDTEFPNKNAAKQLEEISNTVKKIHYIAYYKSYIFPQNGKIIKEIINQQVLLNRSINNIYFHESVAGTATIIYNDNKKIAFLTCAHIGDFPDTLFTYFRPSEVDGGKYIQNVSIKEKEHYYVDDIPEGGELELIKKDSKIDVAVLGKTLSKVPEWNIPVFNYPAGKAKDLQWGSFVYIIGYPIGFKMITRGIVSKPHTSKDGSFMIDALFNRGISGGIVLAIRDGVPNFELVGMVKSVAAESEYILIPGQQQELLEYGPDIPYDGDMFVFNKRDINYGVTYTVSIESIKTFFNDNKRYFSEKGFVFNF